MADTYEGAVPVVSSEYEGAVPITKTPPAAFTYKSDAQQDSNPSNTSASQDLSKGIDIGLKKFGIGSAQLFSQIGTEEHNLGQIMPVFKDGKLTFGYPPREELAQKNEALNTAAEELGPIGRVGKFFSDPTLYAFPEGKGLETAMAMQGGISSALSPSSDQDQSILGRGTETGIASALSALGGKGLELAGPYAKDAAIAAGNKLSSMVQSLGPEAGKAIKAAGETIGKGMGELKAPVFNVASALYKAADKLGLKFTGKETAEEVWNKITGAVESKTNEIAENINTGSSRASDADNRAWEVNSNLATSAMYDATKQAGGQLYSQATKIGEKESAPAEDFISDLDAAIKHMETQLPTQTANPGFGRSLQTLRDVHTAVTGGEEGISQSHWDYAQRLFNPEERVEQKITGAQLIDLDQALNENYGRTGFTGKGGQALKNLQAKVQNTIQTMSYEFSKAYQTAKDFWREKVIKGFEENPVVKKYWDIDDHTAFKAYQRGRPLPPDLMDRVEGLTDRIKTYNDLAALKNTLPPEAYDRLRATKFLTLMRKAGLDASKIGNEETYKRMVQAIGDKPNDLAALDAIKTFMEQMNKRGIKKDLTPAELEESDKLKDRAARALLSYASGGKLNVLKNTMEWVTKKSPEAMHGALRGVAKEAAKGAPAQKFAPGVIPQVVGAVTADKGGKIEAY